MSKLNEYIDSAKDIERPEFPFSDEEIFQKINADSAKNFKTNGAIKMTIGSIISVGAIIGSLAIFSPKNATNDSLLATKESSSQNSLNVQTNIAINSNPESKKENHRQAQSGEKSETNNEKFDKLDSATKLKIYESTLYPNYQVMDNARNIPDVNLTLEELEAFGVKHNQDTIFAYAEDYDFPQKDSLYFHGKNYEIPKKFKQDDIDNLKRSGYPINCDSVLKKFYVVFTNKNTPSEKLIRYDKSENKIINPISALSYYYQYSDLNNTDLKPPILEPQITAYSHYANAPLRNILNKDNDTSYGVYHMYRSNKDFSDKDARYCYSVNLNNTLKLNYSIKNIDTNNPKNTNETILALWYPLTKEVIAKLPERYRIKIEREYSILEDVETGKIAPEAVCAALGGEESYLGLCALSGANLSKAELYPNPSADHKLHFKIALAKGCDLKVSVYNSIGSLVANLGKYEKLEAGEKVFDYPIDIPNGAYYLVANDNFGEKVTMSFIVRNSTRAEKIDPVKNADGSANSNLESQSYRKKVESRISSLDTNKSLSDTAKLIFKALYALDSVSQHEYFASFASPDCDKNDSLINVPDVKLTREELAPFGIERIGDTIIAYSEEYAFPKKEKSEDLAELKSAGYPLDCDTTLKKYSLAFTINAKKPKENLIRYNNWSANETNPLSVMSSYLQLKHFLDAQYRPSLSAYRHFVNAPFCSITNKEHDTTYGTFITRQNSKDITTTTRFVYSVKLNNTLKINYAFLPADTNDKRYKATLSLWYPLTKEVIAKLPDRYRTKIEREYSILEDVETGRIAPEAVCAALGGEESYLGLCALTGANLSKAEIYPNPAINSIKFKITLAKDCNLKISVYNPTGALVSNLGKYESMQKGEKELSFSLGNIPNGRYFLVANDNSGEKVTIPFEVLK